MLSSKLASPPAGSSPNQSPQESAELLAAIIAQHSKSFALASRLLPPERRLDAVALYAWCRACDDAVDSCPREQQPAALDRLRAELDSIYAGQPQRHPVQTAFQQVAAQRRIPRLYAEELIAGMEMDVLGHRYRTREDLRLYCYRVAGVVGLMMCHVLGVQTDDALTNAVHLGMAMQLTNISRDVGEDWQMGRLYIPRDMLGSSADILLDSDDNPRPETEVTDAAVKGDVQQATRELLTMASSYYRSGDRGLRSLSWRVALAIRTARLVYADIGRQVARQQFDPAAGRAFVTQTRKLSLVGWSLLCQWADTPRRAWQQQRYDIPTRVMSFEELEPAR